MSVQIFRVTVSRCEILNNNLFRDKFVFSFRDNVICHADTEF